MSNELMNVGPLKQALALATEAGDINALRDVAATASALRRGAQARGLGVEAENQAAEVVLRAERAMGQALVTMAETGERQPRGSAHGRLGRSLSSEETNIPTVEELTGVSRNTSAKWQLLARIPLSTFEDKVAGLLATGERFAKMDFYRLVKGGEKAQKAAQKDIREAMHADDATTEFRAFEKAVTGLVITALPDDELLKVAGMIRNLAAAYNEERARRQAAA